LIGHYFLAGRCSYRSWQGRGQALKLEDQLRWATLGQQALGSCRNAGNFYPHAVIAHLLGLDEAHSRQGRLLTIATLTSIQLGIGDIPNPRLALLGKEHLWTGAPCGVDLQLHAVAVGHQADIGNAAEALWIGGGQLLGGGFIELAFHSQQGQ
jgi:hypothetical protein